MNRMQRQVREFHETFDIPAPSRLDVDGFPRQLRVDLIKEEAGEFEEAAMSGDVPEMVDALCDLLYVTFGSAVALGVDIEPFFDEVHRSNMAKRGGLKRADGKQMKPDGWVAPRIREMLEYGVGRVADERVETSGALRDIRSTRSKLAELLEYVDELLDSFSSDTSSIHPDATQ